MEVCTLGLEELLDVGSGSGMVVEFVEVDVGDGGDGYGFVSSL